MRWRMGRRSTNIEDRRGVRLGGRGAAGGGIGLLIILVIAVLLGADPVKLLSDISSTGVDQSSYYEQQPVSEEDRELADFVSVVLADTEDTWTEIFAEYNGAYREPTLVLFSGAVESACGYAQSAVGPFYCPEDQKVYIDLSFYRDLKNRYNAPGDFAQAYVIAHEVGHHVQNLMGVLQRVQQAQRAARSEAESNNLQVRVELQADCFAGVWAFHTQQRHNFINERDVQGALQTAAAIGDDMLQRRSQGQVVPDSFTHGSSEQRQRWFMTGLRSGQVAACNTFRAQQL